MSSVWCVNIEPKDCISTNTSCLFLFCLLIFEVGFHVVQPGELPMQTRMTLNFPSSRSISQMLGLQACITTSVLQAPSSCSTSQMLDSSVHYYTWFTGLVYNVGFSLPNRKPLISFYHSPPLHLFASLFLHLFFFLFFSFMELWPHTGSFAEHQKYR